MSNRPKPFDGPQWDGWTKQEKHNAVARGRGTPKYQWISVIGQLHVEDEDQSVCLWFPSPEHARQVAECILAAQRGEQIGTGGSVNNQDKLQGLDPQFRSTFLLVKEELDLWLKAHAPGRWVIVTEGKRSLARQAWLYAQGRTRPGPKVTWTMKSKHLKGLAVDIAFGGGNPYEITDDAWEHYGHLCRKHGLVWGGDWTTPDRPHCEAKEGKA